MFSIALILVFFALIYPCTHRHMPADTKRWTNDGVMLDQHYKPWTSITLWLSPRLVLAGRHLLFVNNEYAYLFIRARQPLRYQRDEDN